MDWIAGIQRALDYTEMHLTGEIEYEAVAKQALSSPFHFQRMFGMLCGFSLGDYIRMRRLTLAAEDLMRTDRKVIDIAFQYGYDTPESFSRAIPALSRHYPHPSPSGRHGQILLQTVRKTHFIRRQFHGLQN